MAELHFKGRAVMQLEKSKKILAVLWFILGASASQSVEAKRMMPIPPVLSTFSVGGYNTTISPKRYCEVEFSFKESIFNSPIAEDLRVSGGNLHFVVSLTNIGKSVQNVRVLIEDVTFRSCYWNVDGIGNSDACYDSFHNNSANGYAINRTIPVGDTEILTLQVGCQGNTANRNCYLFSYPPVGQPVNNGISHFGVPAIWNPGPASTREFYCYKITSAMGIAIEVAEDRGSLIGTVSLGTTGALGGGAATKTTGASNFNINGGRPF